MPAESSVIKSNDKILAIAGIYKRSEIVGVESISGDLPNTSTYVKDINIIIGDGETSIIPGTYGYSAPISFSGNISGWRVLETSNPAVSGNIVIDVLKVGEVDYPSESVVSIAGTNKPNLDSQVVNSSEDLSSWDVELNVEDMIGFSVEENTDCKKVHLIISVEVGF